MDSIFRDLNLNNPSNNLKTLGNQKLTPYNECCFGQQCNAGKPRVRIDSWAVLTNGAPGYNQSYASAVSVEDGDWHHVAFTYAHTNKAVKLYVDYVLCAQGNTYSNLVYDTGSLRIGQGAGDTAFDGWIDEIRITAETLMPDKFLTATEPLETRGHWTFDDGPVGSTAGTLTNTYYSPFMHGAAERNGGDKPVFSLERPNVSTWSISEGRAGLVVNRNDSSLFFVNTGLPVNTNSSLGGLIRISGSVLPAQVTNFTAQAFVKVNRHVNYPQIIGKKRSETGGLSWSLGLNSEGNLRARFDTQDPPDGTGFNQTFNSAALISDGRWHHVAMTYDAALKTVRLYRDYSMVCEGFALHDMVCDAGDIIIGNGDQAFDGWIDEVSLCGRVLEPGEFLYTVEGGTFFFQ